jgi:hypothetical protein
MSVVVPNSWTVHEGGDKKQKENLENTPKTPYGGGNGGGSEMEKRIAVLEAHMEHASSDIAGVKDSLGSVDVRMRSVETTLATISERVSHLPSKGFIVVSTLGALAFIAALIGFSEQVQAFFGQG